MLSFLGVLAVLAGATPDTLVVPVQEVVVTASRVAEPLLHTPAAVTVIPRATFESTRTISLRDALAGVPGVFVQSRSGAQDVRITIRGYGARGNGERSNAGNLRGIRVLTDGVPITEPDGRTSLDLADLASIDRIEVLRSNVSSLYGNASGGVVNLRTDLEFERPYFEYGQRAGAFGFHREQGATGFTLGEARGLAVISNTTLEGWREHSSSTTAQGRVRLSAPIDPRTRLGVLLDAVNDLNRFPGALTQAQLDSAPQQANPKFVARDERRHNRVARAGLTLDRAWSDANALALMVFVEPKLLQRSERNRFRDFTRVHAGGSAVWSGTARPSPTLELRTRAGADESNQDGAILFYNLGPGGTRSNTLFANKREGANGAGAFLEEELTWNERWSARGAVRYDNIRYVAEDFIDPTLDATRRFTHVTPKGSVAWRNDRHMIFAALGGGVEVPAFNEIDPPPPFDTLTSLNPFLDAVESTTLEIGARGSTVATGGSTLRYDAAVYQIDIRNDLVPFDGGAYFLTAGRSRRRGFELGLDWLPIATVTIGGTLTLTDNTYLEYPGDLGDFANHDIAGLPKMVGTTHVGWTAPWSLSADLGVESIGPYFANDANTAEVDAVTLVNATARWKHAFGQCSLSAFVSGTNLTDQAYVASVFINGINREYFEPGLPRSASAGAQLSWR